VGIREDHPLLGQAIDMRRWNLRGFWCEAMNVPIAQVIAKNQYNVGLTEDGKVKNSRQKQTKNNSFHDSPLAPKQNANKKKAFAAYVREGANLLNAHKKAKHGFYLDWRFYGSCQACEAAKDLEGWFLTMAWGRTGRLRRGPGGSLN